MFSGTVLAQDIAVPIYLQAPLLIKVVSFDRNVAQLNAAKYKIGIIYQGRNRNSKNIKDELEEFGRNTSVSVGGKKIEFVFYDVDKTDLSELLAANRVNAVYVTPLRAYDIGYIVEITRANKILSMSGVEDYVEKGVSVGIGLSSDKPIILINAEGYKNEGVNFSSQLLKLCKIVE